MRPVDSKYEVSQDFGSYATAGVVGNANGNEVQQLVAMYGNYQPFGHAGQDIATPVGTPVYAISDGTVLWAGWGEDLPGDESWGPSGYFRRWALYKFFPGICTVIQHWWGISVTAHMSDAPLNVGDNVREGQQIGLTGNTKARGQTVGAHVHIEALIDLSYTTGGGLIYGRTDPTQFYGGLAATGSITPEDLKEFLMALNDQQQADIYWQLCTPEGRNAQADLTVDRLLARKLPLIDQSGATNKVTGTTTPETKFSWMAHNDAQNLSATVALTSDVAEVKELLKEILAAKKEG